MLSHENTSRLIVENDNNSDSAIRYLIKSKTLLLTQLQSVTDAHLKQLMKKNIENIETVLITDTTWHNIDSTHLESLADILVMNTKISNLSFVNSDDDHQVIDENNMFYFLSKFFVYKKQTPQNFYLLINLNKPGCLKSHEGICRFLATIAIPTTLRLSRAHTTSNKPGEFFFNVLGTCANNTYIESLAYHLQQDELLWMAGDPDDKNALEGLSMFLSAQWKFEKSFFAPLGLLNSLDRTVQTKNPDIVESIVLACLDDEAAVSLQGNDLNFHTVPSSALDAYKEQELDNTLNIETYLTPKPSESSDCHASPPKITL